MTGLCDYRKTDESDFDFTQVHLLSNGADYKTTPVIGNAILPLGMALENSEKHTNMFVNHCGLDIWGSELHSILGNFVTISENEWQSFWRM
jgi:hypothetical protein